MRKIMVWLAFAVLFVSVGALAQEEQASPPPESAKVSGWDEGFWVRSADDQFKLKLGGRVQLQEFVEDRTGLPKTPNKPAPDKFDDTFLLRRGNIELSGTLFEKVDFSAILNTRTGSPGGAQRFNFFADATYNILPYFRVVGGVIGLPLDFLGEDSSRWFLTVEPPLVATQEDGLKGFTIARQSFGAPPDLGLRLEGEIGDHVAIQAGAANGPGFQGQNNNNELSYGARIQVNILKAVGGKETDFEWSEEPKLSFAAGTIFEDEDTADTFIPTVQHKWSWTSSGGGRFRYRGFAFNVEGYYRKSKVLGASRTQDTNGDGKLRDTGYYANAGYYFVPHKLEAVLTASQVFREGPDNNANEFGGGLNWYIHKNNVKWQLDYTNVLDYDDVAGLNNATFHRVRTMFSIQM